MIGMAASKEDIAPYLRGDVLWGDDFSPAEIEQWFFVVEKRS